VVEDRDELTQETGNDEQIASPENVDEGVAKVQEEVARLQRELEESRDKHLRLLAEFDNYKKRVLKERSELLKYQGEKVFVDLLDVIDDLDLAMQHKEGDPDKFRSGVALIHKKFLDVLSRWEVRSESAVGKGFDPERQNAISRLVIPDKEPNTVVEELKKTYFYKDKMIRVGEVIVAVGPGEGMELS